MNLSLKFCLVLLAFNTLVYAEILAEQPAPQTADWAKSWWMERHEQKLIEIKNRKQIDLVFIGDSITHEFEKQGKTIWQKYYADRNALNLGFSGDRTEHVLWRIQNGELDGFTPKLCVIMIGTNNTGYRNEEPKHTAAGIKAIINQINNNLVNTQILLLAIFPRDRNPDSELRMINVQVNRLLKKLVKDMKNVHYMDINHYFLDEHGMLSRFIMPDLLHPNKIGYEIWAEAIESTIQKLLTSQ